MMGRIKDKLSSAALAVIFSLGWHPLCHLRHAPLEDMKLSILVDTFCSRIRSKNAHAEQLALWN